jgi:hypothetical protein
MIALAQAHADLIANPRPALFLDTCTLLDIVRAPLRDLALTVEAALELRALASTGAVALFVQDIVPGEWNEHLISARKNGEEGVRAYVATWHLAALLGQPAPPGAPLPPGRLIDELQQLSHDLLSAAQVLDRDHGGMSWAISQVAAKRKPSSAKGTVKDCHILGHALQLSTLLQAVAFPRSRWLVSSNKTDFATPNTNFFHSDIATEAAVAGLGYAVSLEAALAELRAVGEIP